MTFEQAPRGKRGNVTVSRWNCQNLYFFQVKKFIYEELDKFERSEFKKVPGKSPEAIFYNSNGEELERVDMAKMNKNELKALFIAKGIPLKAGHDEI